MHVRNPGSTLIPGKYYTAYIRQNPCGYHLVRFIKLRGELASVRLYCPKADDWVIRKRIPVSAFGVNPQPHKRKKKKKRKETP